MASTCASSITSLAQSYVGKRVFLTGHTGFKGPYLALWLHEIGASVYGYALPPTTPSHYELMGINKRMAQEWFADICDISALHAALASASPDIIFHLAAQPLVRQSYKDPLATFRTNILGTAHMLDAARRHASVRAIVVITTDKVYENREWCYGYREIDSLGGYDPYSASKACAEIITACMRQSFFRISGHEGALIASARAGNVIGGGDFSEDRLFPDIYRAIQARTATIIRSPNATRPWQHVLEPLYGYLCLGQALLQGRKECATSFNFGPESSGNLCVSDVLAYAKNAWDAVCYEYRPLASALHEAHLLMLDSSKARSMLGVAPIWDAKRAITETMAWYKAFSTNHIITLHQLECFFSELERRDELDRKNALEEKISALEGCNALEKDSKLEGHSALQSHHQAHISQEQLRGIEPSAHNAFKHDLHQCYGKEAR